MATLEGLSCFTRRFWPSEFLTANAFPKIEISLFEFGSVQSELLLDIRFIEADTKWARKGWFYKVGGNDFWQKAGSLEGELLAKFEEAQENLIEQIRVTQAEEMKSKAEEYRRNLDFLLEPNNDDGYDVYIGSFPSYGLDQTPTTGKFQVSRSSCGPQAPHQLVHSV